MRPTSRIHKEYDISADIALIEAELHAQDDVRETESKRVCHVFIVLQNEHNNYSLIVRFMIKVRSLFSNISKILLELRFGSAAGLDELLAGNESLLNEVADATFLRCTS